MLVGLILLRSNQEIDNNFWILGSEISFFIDNWMLGVGYDRTEQLDNYEADDFSLSIDQTF